MSCCTLSACTHMMRALLGVCVTLVLICSVAHGGVEHKKKQLDQGDQQHSAHHDHHGNNSLRLHKENAEFAFSLYKYITSQPDSQDKNVFFSPLSVSLALAALAVGTRGLTQKQLYDGIGFNNTHLSTEEVNDGFHQIIMDLNQESEVDLSLGTALFINDTFQPLPEFLQILKRYFHSEVFSTDFSKSKEAAALINDYVHNKTQGKITELVDKLDSDTLMFLLSYMYFKGKWELMFNHLDTREDKFYIDENVTVPVQMMYQKNKFNYYYDREISSEVLQLLYKGSVSMILVLPKYGLKSLDGMLSKGHITKWQKWMKQKEYKIFLPKFSISTTNSLQDVLTNMGVTDVFDVTADFSGISEERRLLLSKIIHKATLDVDEMGSTAAAVTEVLFTPLSYFHSPTLKFNHPFVVIIYDHKTRNVLFMGRVVNPVP